LLRNMLNHLANQLSRAENEMEPLSR
jgi:hypothetical protein